MWVRPRLERRLSKTIHSQSWTVLPFALSIYSLYLDLSTSQPLSRHLSTSLYLSLSLSISTSRPLSLSKSIYKSFSKSSLQISEGEPPGALSVPASQRLATAERPSVPGLSRWASERPAFGGLSVRASRLQSYLMGFSTCGGPSVPASRTPGRRPPWCASQRPGRRPLRCPSVPPPAG